MNSRQNTIFIFRFGLEYYLMMIALIFQSVIGGPTICGYPASSNNVVSHKWYQFFCITSGNHLHSKPAQSFPFSFHGNCNGNFILGTTPLFAALASKVELIYLEIARKFFPSRPYCAATKLLQPLPGSLVTSQTKQLLQVNSIYTGFPGAEPPQRLKPGSQWFSRCVKDGSCCDRLMVFTGTANIEPSGTCPVTGISAPGTRKSFRPPQLGKILKACGFIGEAPIEFKLILREVLRYYEFVHVWPPY